MRVNFIQKIIDKIRGKKVKFNVSILDHGLNNTIEVPKNVNNPLCIVIYGDGNSVKIKDTASFNGYIYIGTSDCYTNNCRVFVGNKTTSNGITIRILEDNNIHTYHQNDH